MHSVESGICRINLVSLLHPLEIGQNRRFIENQIVAHSEFGEHVPTPGVKTDFVLTLSQRLSVENLHGGLNGVELVLLITVELNFQAASPYCSWYCVLWLAGQAQADLTEKPVFVDSSRLIPRLTRCIFPEELGTKFGSMPCGSLASPHIPGSIVKTAAEIPS
ncbi:MAG: hypothetical protein IH994_09205 [Proteobacteria bacterium]|nr:hypothetical protein [Pseudomonadota bacterium]